MFIGLRNACGCLHATVVALSRCNKGCMATEPNYLLLTLNSHSFLGELVSARVYLQTQPD